ncbi:MAG: L,D-transpeptidase family protein [Gemmatimonadaceae bacterium]|nr:L,D-transpeptidase family protein [Gemmatimonadaceae bacterium]
MPAVRVASRWIAIGFLLCTGSGLRAQEAASVADALIAEGLTHVVSEGELASLRWPRLTDLTDDLRRAYDGNGWRPLWSHQGLLTAPARALLESLQDLGTRGLDPEDHDVASLRALADSGLVSAADRVRFDMTLSVSALRTILALRRGRISATEAHAHLQFPRDSVDYAAELMRLAATTTPTALLDAQEPPYVHYRLLRDALAVYRREAGTDSLARHRAQQITLTMERWRWLPHAFTTEPIIVNIPAFRLHALAEGSDRESDMLSMDVVVGDAVFHQTPVFSDVMEYIVFAPYWDVPASIAAAELLPLARRDPHLLTVNNYEIVSAQGPVLTPSAASVRAVAEGRARIRQLPGGSNALGRVKFVFPNDFNVYLHDTPVKAAFLSDRRDISHGCIRIADPTALARHLLRDQPAWDAAAIEAAMNRREPLRVPLSRGIPVHVLYATAVALEDGRVIFHDDIYGHDAALAAQLARGYPYRR